MGLAPGRQGPDPRPARLPGLADAKPPASLRNGTRAAPGLGYSRGVNLPFEPPIEPMLAKLADEIPAGAGWQYEPKWDGFRALVFRDGDEVFIQSRDLKPLDRYFPELPPALRANLPDRCVLDGEVVIAGPDGLDFDSLLLRIHPAASRVKLLAARTPAMGANEWRSASDWPLPETQWTKFYLNSWERLRTAPFTPLSAGDELPPDAFVQNASHPIQQNPVLTLPERPSTGRCSCCGTVLA